MVVPTIEQVSEITRKARVDFLAACGLDDPTNSCREGSTFLSQRLAQAGIEHEFVRGQFVGEITGWDIDSVEQFDGIPEEKQRTHYWVYIPTLDVIADITADQFGDYPDITVGDQSLYEPRTSRRITPGIVKSTVARVSRLRADVDKLTKRLESVVSKRNSFEWKLPHEGGPDPGWSKWNEEIGKVEKRLFPKKSSLELLELRSAALKRRPDVRVRQHRRCA